MRALGLQAWNMYACMRVAARMYLCALTGEVVVENLLVGRDCVVKLMCPLELKALIGFFSVVGPMASVAVEVAIELLLGPFL